MWREIAGIWRRMWKGVEANVETTLFAVNSSWLRSRIYLNIHLLFGQTQALSTRSQIKVASPPLFSYVLQMTQNGSHLTVKSNPTILNQVKRHTLITFRFHQKYVYKRFYIFWGGNMEGKKKKKTLFILLNEFDQNVNRCWLNMGLD